MAAHEGSEQQYSLRIGDTVLLYAKEVLGYVFSEVSSSLLNSVAVGKCPLKEPNLPNVHFATFKVVAANKYKAQERLLDVEHILKGREPTTAEKGLKLQAEKDLESELKENELEQERLQGSSLVYGESIQLMHILSKKYLFVSTTHTSRTENTNLRVQLRAENAEGCVFKILPRYKVRSVGDEVRYNDQVKLESVKTEGQFLHCSTRLFQSVGFMVHPTCHELNLSATESALTVIPHYRPMADHSSQVFRSGESVRLFHREYECYIAAEGSFAREPSVVEDVHCRKRHSDHGILKAPSTSANTYWQFEKESDLRSGEPLSWGERVRIKHMPTRRYLSVDDVSHQVSLVERGSSSFTGQQHDLETVFSLFPVIREGDTIQVESYARIKNLNSRTWLHLEKQMPYVRKDFDPLAPGLKGLEWDSAELYMLSATETMNYDDAFTLEQVEEPLLDKFNYVAGAVAVLTSYIKQREDPTAQPLDSRRAYSVAFTLEELAGFLLDTPNARDTKDKQKLLRNLRVLELVIKTLGFFKLDAPDCHEQRKICKACYLVIENYLKGDSRKNENYLARFIDFFQTQVRMGLNAEEVMIEMVEDNDAIVSKMTDSEIDYMIQQFVETRDPRFMEFLGNLCVCAGRPIPKTQNTILEKLVKRHGEKVFYKTAVGGTDFLPEGQGIRAGVVYFKKPDDAWLELSSIAARNRSVAEDREFLESQLQLFGKICKGNNSNTITALDKDGLCYVTFNEAITCVSDEALHPSLRSKYVELITVMFVDVGENRAVLENLSLSFVYNEMKEDPYADTGEDDITALTGVENEYFPEMRDWIKDYISAFAEKNVVASEEDDNNFLADVLGVLSLLVKYGYYDDPKDVDAVLRPLTTVLNGLEDRPFPASEAPPRDAEEEYQLQYDAQIEHFRKEGRFRETAENTAIFAIKERAMEVVDLFFNFRFYVRLQRFIYDFRLLKGDVEEDEQEARGRLLTVVAGLASASESRPPMDLGQLQHMGVELLENPTLVQLARDRLHYIFSKSEYFFEKSEYTSSSEAALMQNILLDLANYSSDTLVQSSLHLLNRLYSSEVTLFSKAIQTQLLVTDRSKQVFQEIGKDLPTLRRYLSIEIGNKERGEIIDILEKFTAMCVLDEEESEPHTQNQKILYNYGVLSDVLSYVLKHGKGASAQVATEQKKVEQEEAEPKPKPLLRKKTSRGGRTFTNQLVFVKCFQFLKALATKNLEVQQRLYDRMNDLLEIEVAVPYMAEVLTEVFTGGPQINLKVREDQVERLFHLVAGGEEGQAELIITLQAMAKVEELDLPVKRNQAFIIKFFSKTREKFCDHVLGEGRQEDRWQLLMEAPDEDPDLQLLLTMTDMLAACSEGENLFIESVCQTVFTVRELLTIISSPFLPPERKRPFARFLVWVYMNTGGDKIQTGASELTSSTEMWGCLDHLNTLLENMGQVMRTLPDTEQAYVREGLTPSSRSYSVSAKSRRRRPRTLSQAIPFVTGEDGKLLPGLLLYFAEGILPLLKSYFAEFFEPPRTEDIRERQLGLASKLLASLLNLSESMTQYFTLDTHVKLFRGTVMTVMRSSDGAIPITTEAEVLANFELKTRHCGGTITRAKERYHTTYAAEVELNETFNKFVFNYRLAYQGPNTARAQIGSKYDTAYSDFLDKQMMKAGDEYLPIGPSFQEHVNCFANRQASHADHVVKPVAERLLTQLQISFSQLEDLDETERSRQDELDIKCLQILRAIIHNEIMLIDPELKENSPEGFRKRCAARLHPVQNSIQGFDNAVARVVPLLSHPNDEIVREVLAFLKAILYSGNHHVQKGMEHLLTTREERLFSTMQALLSHAAITYKERRALLAQVEARMAEEEYLQESFSTLRQDAEGSKKWAAPKAEQDSERKQVHWKKSKPETVEIEIEVTDGGPATETIQLDTVVSATHALLPSKGEDALQPAKREDRSHSPQPSPLLSPKHATSASGKGKLPRRRASNRPLVEALNLFKQSTVTRRPSEGSSQKVDRYANIDDETAELLRFQDSAHIKLALKMLGLMCDGQYRLMQNYLREQKDNIHNINIVGEVAAFIQHFLNDINSETMELVHLILQTLIEMCVGNYPNQQVIYNRQIIDVINRILQLDISEHEQHGYSIQDSVNLKASAVELLEAMLEETSDKTKELVLEIHGGLDMPAMYDTLVDFHVLMFDEEVIAESFDDEAERGLFRTYHVLVHFADYPGIKHEMIAPSKDAAADVHKAWEFCKHRSKSMEVFYRNMEDEKILTRVHFQFDPVNELRDEVVENVKWNVNRDSAEDKLRDFLEWLYAVKKDTIHNNRLYQHWPTRILISFPKWRYYILLFLSLLLNIFVLITFGLQPGDRREVTDLASNSDSTAWPGVAGPIRPNVQDWFSDVALYVFGAIHLFFSIWMSLEYFVVNWPNFVLPRILYRLVPKVKPPDETYSDINIFGLRTVYVIAFLLASILSLPFWGYFYCLCLLHVVVNNDILQRVLRAVTKNGIALIWVAILGAIVLYIYSVISFAFLHESFDPGNNDGNLYCENLWQCFISVIRYGLIDNIGLIIPLTPEQYEVMGLRLLFDVSFFIIVTTIGLNIVFGIIVDTFSELRDDRFRTEQDKKAFCFICSLPNHEFERRAKGFNHHVKYDHNMWTYIYYSIYLDTIDTSDHNAIESFVYTMIREGQLEFFPLLASLALEKEEDTTAMQLVELKSMVQHVLARFKEEEHEKARSKKRDEQKKWEALNLRQQPSLEMSLDSRRPSGFPPQASLDSRPSLEIQPSFDTTFHP